MSQCTRCLLDLNFHSALVTGQGSVCPNCGSLVATPAPAEAPKSSAQNSTSNDETPTATTMGVAPIGPGAPLLLFSRFWQSVRELLFTPARFYSTNAEMLVSPEGLSTALAFAVIIQWLASFCNFIWRLTAGAALESRLDDFFRIAGDVVQGGPGVSESLDQMRDRAIDFLFGAGAIVITPFTTLIKLAVSALLVHAAVRFFMKDSPGRPHSYTTTLKVLAYATGPWILCVIPGVGIVLAYILGFAAAVVGLREVYRTSTFRAMLAVAFPELLLMVFLFGGFVVILFLAFNVLRLVF